MWTKRHFNIYPSLLDGFAYMRSVEGSEEEQQKAVQDFIDTINRVPRDPNYYLARGTALNVLVDGRACHVVPQHPVSYLDRGDEGGVYTVEIDTFSIAFAEALVEQTANWVYAYTPQVYCEADIEVQQGVVTLYGYADYVRDEEVVDLKTTKRYNPDNRDYSEHWQHRVYPYCLMKSGMVQSVERFTYLVAEIAASKATDIVDGTLYREPYDITLLDCEKQLREFLSYEFLPWLEEHRDLIIDTKIFND